MSLYIEQSGDLDRCYRCLTDRLTTLKNRATQLLIKYKSGTLVRNFKRAVTTFLFQWDGHASSRRKMWIGL